MLQVSGVTSWTTQPTGVNGVKKLNFAMVIVSEITAW